MNGGRWWTAELAVLAVAVAGAGMVLYGKGGDGWAWVVSLAVLLGWHGAQALRLHARLQSDLGPSPAALPGAWGRVGAEADARVRRARKRLRQKHRYRKRLAAAVAALPDAVVILDQDNVVEWCNPQAGPLLGLAWPAAAGQPLVDELPIDGLDGLLDAALPAGPWRVASPLAPGTVLSLRVEPISRRTRPRRLLVARDVTSLHNLDRVRQDFIANVSHELRTPLTVLRGFLETMDSAGEELADWAPAIATMGTQAQRMQLLVEDLLTLSHLELDQRAEADPDVPVMVAELLDGVVEEARSLSGESGHVFRLDADRELALLGDGKELRSAFANLVFNAVRHTPPRCRVVVTWAADGAGARFTVKDTGEGIAAEHLPRLTERFYRVDASRSRDSGGTGLGLAIVKHVLLRHDSELEVASRVGIGSTFSCRFPARRVSRT